ncbi:hypothetical protein CHU98_g2541 [Xylaria longipes]|nr:hypothetical protein CHU98_g2541 [Xylaria longipes]
MGYGPRATMPGPVPGDADWRQTITLSPKEPVPSFASKQHPVILNNDSIVVSTWSARFGRRTLAKNKWPVRPAPTAGQQIDAPSPAFVPNAEHLAWVEHKRKVMEEVDDEMDAGFSLYPNFAPPATVPIITIPPPSTQI